MTFDLKTYLRYIKRRFFPTSLGWNGNFPSWEAAEKLCGGYDHKKILEKVKNAALTVKKGEASFERDSVLFYKDEFDNKLIEILIHTKNPDNSLRVIDVGGSLGSTYYQNRKALNGIAKLDWSIVEQSHYVDCGRTFFEDDKLHFYYTIEDALFGSQANVLLSACMLQYISKPYEWLQKFIDSGINSIVLDRIGLIEATEDVITVQTVPPSIYKATYPCWFFNREKIIAYLNEKGFELADSWDDSINIPITVNGVKAYWRSFFFKKKKQA